jgi:hypothetical protein
MYAAMEFFKSDTVGDHLDVVVLAVPSGAASIGATLLLVLPLSVNLPSVSLTKATNSTDVAAASVSDW